LLGNYHKRFDFMIRSLTYIGLVSLVVASCAPQREPAEPATVAAVMDNVITRIYEKVPPEQFDSIDDAFMLHALTTEEKKVLATRYQHFEVNVPVTVSLMRHKDQAVVPFWLKDAGFVKTSDEVKSEEYAYEVWVKKYGAGVVELGINGFDKHRPVYFIAVGPQNEADKLTITNVYPDYVLHTMRVGAFTYHDWSGLLLTEVPAHLVGQQLFTTVRGRAREAHVVDGFRTTRFPSSANPDQLMLNWSGPTQSTMDVQWRTDTTISDGIVRYWQPGTPDTLQAPAEHKLLQDRMLYNDRYVYRHHVRLKALKPGTRYFYQAGSIDKQSWSPVASFETEAAPGKPFNFVWFGDTHCFPDSGRLVSLAQRNNPDAAFYMIAGDIVSTGLYRNEWDLLFGYSHNAFASKPLMPVPGNHDRQDGLGAQLYYDLFSLPKNGPEKVDKESSYAFEYGNALFIMIDATQEVADHTAWIETQLSKTSATWKFVMFHFPPYNFEEPYPDIQQAWGPLFDKYHVDMVMGGHIHYYMRSKPMKQGKVVKSMADGTVYTISISIPGGNDRVTPEPYAVIQDGTEYFYQRMEIDGNAMKYQAVDSKGKVRDALTITK
jgi:acid phosphatase type 7